MHLGLSIGILGNIALGLALQIPFKQNVPSIQGHQAHTWDDCAACHDPLLQEEWRKINAKLDHTDFSSFANNIFSAAPISREQLGAKFQVHETSNANYTLRVKKNHPESLGLDTVNQYTGYLDIDSDKHLFFWFFESRNDPQNDPVILWLNGGPGCSSSIGLFFELGPSSVNGSLAPVFNPYSWNSNASVIFLDQPVNVGLSYSESHAVNSTAGAAVDFVAFLDLFFQEFSHLQGNDFHIASESYGGHYVPKFAAEVNAHKPKTYNLTSVLIGNGLTDAKTQWKTLIPMGCGEGGHPQILSDEKCQLLEKEIYPKCAHLLDLCSETLHPSACAPAYDYCENNMFAPIGETSVNPYDIRIDCFNKTSGDCYKDMASIDDYLNLETVREAIGASEKVEKFYGCSSSVDDDFALVGDKAIPHSHYVATLLDNDIPVLIYAGDKDYRCNWIGNYEWTDQLKYSSSEQFSSKPLSPWYVDGKEAGQIRNHDKFTYLRIYEAGHMVPHDRPQESLSMLNAWISGDYSLGTN